MITNHSDLTVVQMVFFFTVFLTTWICATGIDLDKARKEEERVMLQDAMEVLEKGGTLTPHPNTKATALHVAAAKGYIEVLKWASDRHNNGSPCWILVEFKSTKYQNGYFSYGQTSVF